MSVRKVVNALQGDLNRVRSDLSTLTSALGTSVQHGTQETKERLLASVNELQSRAAVLQKCMGRGFDEGVGYLDDHAHAKPYHTAILAGLVGGIVAWLILRQRDERDV